ncbi:MAG: prepilin peptidase [Candidatus Omnitrophota bacterium]
MILAYIATFVFGAVVGSFLNVCIHRLPRGESIVFPSSHCPNCNRPIPWYCNIPFISYVSLGRRCKFCKAKISFRYFLVEFLTALVFLLLFLKFGLSLDFLIYASFSSALITASFIDIEHWVIPDEITLPGIISGFLISVIYPALQGETSRLAAARDSLLGIFIGFASLFLVGFAGRIVYKKEAMGGGDITLLMFIGAFLGWKLTLAVFLLSALLGSIVGMPKLWLKKQETIQYGPFLALAAFICVLFKNEILSMLP